MKIFIDTAKIEEIKEANRIGIIDGVTTNPSLVAKTGKTFEQVAREITAEIDGPISLEAVSPDAEGIMKEARSLHAVHKNVVTKIPCTAEGLKAVKMCKAEKIPTNVTLVFSPSQALLSAKAGATYISPFVGRIDDISGNGMELVQQIVEVYRNYDFSTEVIVASIRNPVHFVEAALIGADVATVPYDVLMRLLDHPLTAAGIRKFLDDWAKIPKQ
jgi:transaldolase